MLLVRLAEVRRRSRAPAGASPAEHLVREDRDVDLELVAGPERWFRSLGAALDWGVTTYDALDVLLALDLDAEVVTADARLASAARAHSLPVRLLAG
ncbi:MAG: hypothetical protein ACR2FV_06615 [Ornithinimicrobium sp.]|uniref:hypothetical protein n=1 Tax=Ornithinimicrobium sp. TaxID=1977084 RepID=UPI003D9B349A